MFSPSSWTTSLSVCIIIPTEVWEPPQEVVAESLLSHLLYRLINILHPSLTLSNKPMLRIALNEYLWIFLGTNFWDRIGG